MKHEGGCVPHRGVENHMEEWSHGIQGEDEGRKGQRNTRQNLDEREQGAERRGRTERRRNRESKSEQQRRGPRSRQAGAEPRGAQGQLRVLGANSRIEPSLWCEKLKHLELESLRSLGFLFSGILFTLPG